MNRDAARAGLTLSLLLALAPRPLLAADRVVSDAAQLREAIDAAQPGDTILLEDGVYAMNARLNCDADASAEAPITVRARNRHAARIDFDTVEGFNVSAPHWRFEGLHLRGVCAQDSNCEHALHIVGRADHSVLRDLRVQNFNAHIKANGQEDGPGGARVWPDDVLVEGSEFFNDAPRQTGNPVTPIDVVGGRRWIIRANFIHDHAKGGGNNISYAAFLKGNSRDGLFERNLVICELEHSGQTRLGLSFGGGGTGPDSICEDGSCNPEHQGGVMRNNVILNCPSDVGIYLNEARQTRLLHNTLINTTGIDVRFDTSSALLRNNLLDGRIRERDGGQADSDSNLAQLSAAQLMMWFADAAAGDFTLLDGAMLRDQGAGNLEVPDDFCGNHREDGMLDIGAFEYGDAATPCMANALPPMGMDNNPVDRDMGGGDMGQPGADMQGAGQDMGQPGADMKGPDMDRADDMAPATPAMPGDGPEQEGSCALSAPPSGLPGSQPPAALLGLLLGLGFGARRRGLRG